MLIISIGCNTERIEWVHIGEWTYINNSSHNLEITGGITDFTTSSPNYHNFTLNTNETYSLECRGDGDKEVSAEAIPSPYEDIVQLSERVIQIIINKKDVITLNPETSIRNRRLYIVDKLSSRHYRFIYVFTDENIAELNK